MPGCKGRSTKARDGHALWHLWAWMHRRGANVTQEGFDKLMPCIIYGIERRWIESASMSLDGVDAEENQRLLLRWAFTDEGSAVMRAYNDERLKEERDAIAQEQRRPVEFDPEEGDEA